MKTENKPKHPNSHDNASPARRARHAGARVRICTHPEKKQRQQAAQERQEEYDKLSLQQKLERALERGHEGTREVKKLQGRLAAQNGQKKKK